MLPLQQFQDFIEKEALFTKDNKILLAVSGGRDSVLMLHLFKALSIEVGVAHCNFNLRAEEAQRDEHFVKMLCDRFETPFYVTHFDTKKYAAVHKISTQMAARDLRYQWFETIRGKEGYDYIALAQHQNDAIETVLINLIRGTGISGLHGILPKRDFLIRPLLFLNREEIDQLIEDNHINFVEDGSNLSTDYTRNKLRLQVIPHLKEINPNLENTFTQNMARFSEIETFLKVQVEDLSQKLLQKKADGIYIALDKIAALKPQQLLLFELLKPFGFTNAVVEEILASVKSLSGTHFFSSHYQAIINRDYLIIAKHPIANHQHQVIHPNMEKINFLGQEICMSFSDDLTFEPLKFKSFADFDKLIFPLILRSWEQGDKFIPLGMRNFKKISDFFIDEKLPLHLKETTPLLINGNGEIIWVAGMRPDNRYKLTGATKKVAIFELKIN
ncbi:tRNA lysidine(34) synthetase TilS [Pedobacter punctiformis]|uniref:tRNA(Ile)-lysidine synthase n=1 Tax=Pedobacter punctiformis TaxID=3004097 RepID=A0ABT4LBS8_9SPHI|nr:tRNA lysidine(34) synthetase TilS [Pedobacter sp. HCMS5-2]MCZ4245348.1 tRNA lysidine(34) synthetase TilS [Pedobacter sp. HCMS5-2]